MRHIGTVLAAIGGVGCWYFVVSYWALTRGDFRLTPEGRHIMQFTANLGVLFSLIVAARIWPDYPGRDAVTLVAFALLVGQIWWRIVLMHRAQHDRSDGRSRS
jgi:hypothetical protein